MFLKMVEAELIMKFNFNMPCKEFYYFLKLSDGHVLSKELKHQLNYM